VNEPADPDAGPSDGSPSLADRIEQARFTVAFRGFEPREVQDFLHDIAAELRGRTEAEPLGGAGRLRSNAQREADDIIAAAREDADRILNEATLEADELRKEAATFREQARATVLESIRDANALLERARREASGL